jgi:hypothetical protein
MKVTLAVLSAGAIILICAGSVSAEIHESDSANYVMPG